MPFSTAEASRTMPLVAAPAKRPVALLVGVGVLLALGVVAALALRG